MSLLLLLGAFLQSAPASQPADVSEPLRFKLAAAGEVCVPVRVPRDATALDLFVHFHGAARVVEREFDKTGRVGVIVAVNFNGLSSAYAGPFTGTRLFEDILAEALAALKDRGRVAREARWGRVCVSSFSAGFGAVRVLLSEPAAFERIDALVLADTVYAGYVEREGRRIVNPEHVEPFRRFARRALAGEKQLILSHCHLQPEGYAGTHEVADALLAALELSRAPADVEGPGELRVTSIVEKGRFHLFGCAGDTGADHGRHLTHLGYWLGKVDWE